MVTPAFRRTRDFLRRAHALQDNPIDRQRGLLRFHRPDDPVLQHGIDADVPYTDLMRYVAYCIQRMEYDDAGMPEPRQVTQRFRRLERRLIMAKTTTTTKSKSQTQRGQKAGSRPSASNYLYQLLSKNNKTQYDDYTLQKMVLERFPESKVMQRCSNIQNFRRTLNNGKAPGFPAPEKPIVRYGPKPRGDAPPQELKPKTSSKPKLKPKKAATAAAAAERRKKPPKKRG